MMPAKHIIYATTLLIAVLFASCRNKYYNCECAYENENGDIDTLLLSVKTTNTDKAAQKCKEAEIDVAIQEDFFAFCTLQ